MASNRFDLEQEILACWHVTNDVNLLYAHVMEKDMTKDEIANVLLGIKSIYDMKFEKMWDTFENCVHNSEI